jgi:hypothetical protein
MRDFYQSPEWQLTLASAASGKFKLLKQAEIVKIL